MLRLPGELTRFQNLPLMVQFTREDGKYGTPLSRPCQQKPTQAWQSRTHVCPPCI